MAFIDDDFWYHLGEIVDLKRSGDLTPEQAKWHLANLMASGPGVSVIQLSKNLEVGEV